MLGKLFVLWPCIKQKIQETHRVGKDIWLKIKGHVDTLCSCNTQHFSTAESL